MMVESGKQLEELLGDPGYSRTIALLTKEVMSKWHLSYTDARGSVLSAIGEPTALASIHEAWVLAKTGVKPALPALISRRRVLDLLGKDARRTGHSSFPLGADELEADRELDVFHMRSTRDPEAQLECEQFIQLVRGAIACFAAKGVVQRRQAHLLRRRALDEVSYSELSAELACGEPALRVRVHAAMRALHNHILKCHPELLPTRVLLVCARNV
jgi:hypothetical protein